MVCRQSKTAPARRHSSVTKNKPLHHFPVLASPPGCPHRKGPERNVRPRAKEPVATWFLRGCWGCKAPRGRLFAYRREEDAGARLLSAAAMIPVSLLVVVVGGWTAVYLTDLVLKVRASGLRPKPTVPMAGAQGPMSPEAFSLPLPSAAGAGRRTAGSHVRPSAWRICTRGVNKAGLAAGGVWRPARLPHCGRCYPKPLERAREVPVMGS
jgi:hypothetical protein